MTVDKLESKKEMMNTYSVPSRLTCEEFFQLSEFFKEEQLKNPQEHGLVIKGHHYENGTSSRCDPNSLGPIPLTPEESQCLAEYLTYKDPQSWGLPEYDDWIGIVTEPEFKDEIPGLEHSVLVEDWDKWAKEVQEKENLLEAQAKSPQIGGEYFVPRQDVVWGIGEWHKRLEDGSARVFLDGDWHHGFAETWPPWEDLAEARSQKNILFCGSVILPEKRAHSVRLGPGKVFGVLDAENKMVVNATITHKGMNYHTARCDKGAIYIDLKFSSYIPEIGEDVKMIVRLKEADRACPFACVKILQY